MAIDTSMFAADIAAGSYAVGDVVRLTNIRGPAVVRDGYGEAKLKTISTYTTAASSAGSWVIHVKNSNWVDDMSNPAIQGAAETAMADNSGGRTNGHDTPLYPNSGWDVYAVCVAAGSATGGNSFVCLIDIDYPKVLAVQEPDKAIGAPVTIDGTETITAIAAGSIVGATWSTFSKDIFKAGYRYLLTEASFRDGVSALGFISISSAAGQQVLERIIPVRAQYIGGLKSVYKYSTPLVKGPMNLNFLAVGTAGSQSIYWYLDFVKKTI